MKANATSNSTYAVLLLGVAAVSSAAVLIRLADAPPLTAAFYRMAVAAAIVLPVALVRQPGFWRGVGRKDWALLALSSLFLALHFGFWIASLSYTSVASSVLIVTANPFLVALASAALYKEVAPRWLYAGIGVALAGGIVIAWGDVQVGGRAVYGDLLALLGMLAIAGYYTVGRGLRARLSLLGYVAPVYAGAAVLLLLAALAGGSQLTGFSPQGYLYLFLIGLVPQVFGHSALNWALGYLPAPLVSTAVMLEPVGASVLALAILKEAPSVSAIGGGVLIFLGVNLALMRGRR